MKDRFVINDEEGLASVYRAFAENPDKNIYLNVVGTGIGKGFGLVKLAAERVSQGKQTIYITERTANVQEHFYKIREELKKYGNRLLDKAVMLKSNTDTLIEASERKLFVRLKDVEAVQKNTALYEVIEELEYRTRDYIIKSKNNADKFQERSIRESQDSLSLLCNEMIRKIYHMYKLEYAKKEFFVKLDNVEKLNILKKHPLYSIIIEMFPATRIIEAKILCLTAQKCIFPINTIFFGVYSLYEEELGFDKPLIFIDESDSVKVALVDSFAQLAISKNINMKSLLANFLSVYNQIKNHEIPEHFYNTRVDDDENKNVLIKHAEEFYSYLEILINEFRIFDSHVLSSEEDRGFMYHVNLQAVPGCKEEGDLKNITIAPTNIVFRDSNDGIMYIDGIKNYLDKKMQMLENYKKMPEIERGLKREEYHKELLQRLDKDYRDADGNRSFYYLSYFVYMMESCCYSGLKMLRTALNIEYEYKAQRYSNIEDISQRACAADIVRKMMHLDGEEVDVYCDMILEVRKRTDKIKDEERRDFYYYCFDLISLEPNGAYDTSFKYYLYQNSPEKWLIRFLEMDAKIILSSATGSFMGAYSNFDLTYDEIRSCIWEPPKETSDAILNYIKSQQDMTEYEKYLNVTEFSTSYNFDGTKSKTELIRELSENFMNELSDVTTGEYEVCPGTEVYLKTHEDIKDMLYEAQNRGGSGNPFFRFERMFGIFLSLIDAWYSNHNVVLLSTGTSPTNTDSQDYYYYVGMKKIIKNIQTAFSLRQVYFYEINSRNIDEVRTKVNKKIAEEPTAMIVLSTSFESFMKGINPQITFPQYRSNEYITINNRGEKEINNQNFIADIDCLIFTKPRYMYPSVLDYADNTQDEVLCSMLKCCYYAEELFCMKEVSEKQRLDLIASTLNYNRGNKFNRGDNYLDFKNISEKSNVANMMRYIVQLVGRLGRTGIKHKGVDIYLDRAIIEDLAGNADILNQIGVNNTHSGQQSPEVRSVIEYIKKRISFQNKKMSSTLKDALYQINYANDYINECVNENFNGNTEPLLRAQAACRKVIITQDEFEALDEKTRILFLSMALVNFKTGYKIHKFDKSDNKANIYDVYESIDVMKNGEISFYSLNYFRTMVLNGRVEWINKSLGSSGISLDSPENASYILTPNGFNVLQGNIGESLTFTMFRDLLPDYPLKRLDNEINDRMDFICDKGDVVIAIDSKFYNNEGGARREYQALLKDKDSFKNKYMLKSKVIKSHYKVKYNREVDVFCIIINTLPDVSLEPKYNVVNHYIDNTILTIPNIIDENGKIQDKPFMELKNFLNTTSGRTRYETDDQCV